MNDLQGHRDTRGFTFHSLGLVLLVLLIVYGCFVPEHGIFILCLAISVLIHELGHYSAGRAFNCVIHNLSVFFVPAITYKANERGSLDPRHNTWRDTEWTIGALPLGGYTTLASGNKHAWQRLIISAAGIIANILTFGACYVFSNLNLHGFLDLFINTMMYLSIVLAVLNILPFYPLDGAGVCTAVYEIATGRQPSKTFMTAYKVIGVALFIYLFYINPEILATIIDKILPSGIS